MVINIRHFIWFVWMRKYQQRRMQSSSAQHSPFLLGILLPLRLLIIIISAFSMPIWNTTWKLLSWLRWSRKKNNKMSTCQQAIFARCEEVGGKREKNAEKRKNWQNHFYIHEIWPFAWTQADICSKNKERACYQGKLEMLKLPALATR